MEKRQHYFHLQVEEVFRLARSVLDVKLTWRYHTTLTSDTFDLRSRENYSSFFWAKFLAVIKDVD